MVDTRKIKECPDCASRNIIHSEIRDQIICRDCGLVYEPLTPIAQGVFEKAHKVTVRAMPKSRQLRRKPLKRKASRKKTKRKTTKRKAPKRKTTKRKAPKRKTAKTTKRKPAKRKTTKKKSSKRRR